MRKRIGFAILLGFLVGYPFELSARPVKAEGKELIQVYLKKSEKVEPITPFVSALPGRQQTPA